MKPNKPVNATETFGLSDNGSELRKIPEERLSRLKFFVVFLDPSRQNSEMVYQLLYNCFLSHIFQLIIRNY
jgi:hypothetical protein